MARARNLVIWALATALTLAACDITLPPQSATCSTPDAGQPEIRILGCSAEIVAVSGIIIVDTATLSVAISTSNGTYQLPCLLPQTLRIPDLPVQKDR